MTDTFYDAEGNEVDPDEQSQNVQLSRKDIRRLEKLAKDGQAARAELAQLQKERSFVQAGIPLESKQAKYFIAGYSGDMTPEAIKAEWDDSFGAGTSGQPDPLASELNDLNQANEFASSGHGTPPPDKLAERNAKLAALSQTDPQYQAKFDEIFLAYGGRTGSMVG